MTETSLVSILCEMGIPHRRAVAFERHLDDCSPYGFSGDHLADIVLRYARRVGMCALRDFEEQDTVTRVQQYQQLEMFEHSAYGFAAGRRII
jgi:hypothetical protein